MATAEQALTLEYKQALSWLIVVAEDQRVREGGRNTLAAGHGYRRGANGEGGSVDFKYSMCCALFVQISLKTVLHYRLLSSSTPDAITEQFVALIGMHCR